MVSRKVIYAILALFGSLLTEAQNLVPNPSFEDTVNCPTSIGQLSNAQFWINPTQSTPDYYNVCSTSNFDAVHIPDNAFGYQYARTGNAYAGFYTGGKCLSPPGAREYIQTMLSSLLISGTQYTISFYVNRSDYMRYATSKIGAYLSINAPTRSDMLAINVVPQVQNTNGFLTDTLNWMLVSGTYTAQGGEQYITIGNFYDEAHTDTLNLGTGGTCHYYYIDDVSVIDSNSLGIENYPGSSFKVFPNPASNTLTIEGNFQNTELKILDLLGHVITDSFNGNEQINVQSLPKGIYFIQVRTKEKVYISKFVKD